MVTARQQVQVIIWRQHGGAREYLLLRRLWAQGGFWQAVTGGINAGETPVQAARREVGEETGLTGPLQPTGIRRRFHWVGLTWEETLFTLQAGPATVQLQANEHDAYRWCGLGEGLWRLFWPLNRQHLVTVDRILQKTSTEPSR